ncbi:MAG: hypothetical protein KDD51_11340 [Bdellovibrionales bacterium]|nr:hypothetical protein [Bdellovibrionales bacterium]
MHKKAVVTLALFLCFPLFALRGLCPREYAEADAFPLIVDVDDLTETSPDWERAIQNLLRAGILKAERSWMLPTSLIRDFNPTSFSVAWEHSKHYAPAHAYYQLLIAIAEILKSAQGERTASTFLASVLTRAPELQPHVEYPPSADDLFTSGLGSLWNYMVVFCLLYETEGNLIAHENAFHHLQNKWLLALNSQLASKGLSYPVGLVQEFLPAWFPLTQGSQFSALEMPSSTGRTFQASLSRGGFYRRHGDQETPLGQTIVATVAPGAADMGPEDRALLLRTDHLRVAYLKPGQVAYTVSVQGSDVGMGLRISRNTREAISELLSGYTALTRALPSLAPAPSRHP